MRVLVTGAYGFIGQNLVQALRREKGVEIALFGAKDSMEGLRVEVERADVIYHLAGANRPSDINDFARINRDLTSTICDWLGCCDSKKQIVLSSTIQATLDNAYGKSKLAAEECVRNLARTGTIIPRIYRLPNVFGKLSRPHYNSVVATFCSQIANKQPIHISNPEHELRLVYIDDVVQSFLRHLSPGDDKQLDWQVETEHRCTLQGLADRIRQVDAIRDSLLIPDFSDPLTKALHSTYLSFVDPREMSTLATVKTDPRGWLFELTKSKTFGQVFVSSTLPGVTRGNHYHDSKIEKFCLVQGDAIIRLRKLDSGEVIEYPVNDREIRITDIPPGYTHSIENVGPVPMIVLFWANEIFDPNRPDTHMEFVLK